MVVVTVHTLAAHAHTCVGDTSTLGWVDDAVAQSYMDYLLQRVRVLLPRRGWYVAVFKEFYPRAPTLLGLNTGHGREVCVRFRVPGARTQFLPFHEVLCTTLHELAHCQYARHDRPFWRLYYELVRECEALEMQFVARGVPLYPPHVCSAANAATTTTATATRTTTPTVRARAVVRTTRKAAATPPTQSRRPAAPRAIRSHVVPVTGHRLGLGEHDNNSNNSNSVATQDDATTLRDVLAAAVARRRVHDAAITTATTAAATVALESTSCGRTPVYATRVSLLLHARAAAATALPDALAAPAQRLHDRDANGTSGASATASSRSATWWACPRCTYRNDGDAVVCAMCADDVGDAGNSSNNSSSSSSSSDDKDARYWTCARCTYRNTQRHHDDDDAAVRCDVCDARRSDTTSRDVGYTADTAICILDDSDVDDTSNTAHASSHVFKRGDETAHTHTYTRLRTSTHMQHAATAVTAAGVAVDDVAPVTYVDMPTHSRLDDAAWAMHTPAPPPPCDVCASGDMTTTTTTAQSCCCSCHHCCRCVPLRLPLPCTCSSCCSDGHDHRTCASTTTTTTSQPCTARTATTTTTTATMTTATPHVVPLVAYEQVSPCKHTTRTRRSAAAAAAATTAAAHASRPRHHRRHRDGSRAPHRDRVHRAGVRTPSSQPPQGSSSYAAAATTTTTTTTTSCAVSMPYASYARASRCSDDDNEDDDAVAYGSVDASTLPLLCSRTSFVAPTCVRAAARGRCHEVRLHVYDLSRGALMRYGGAAILPCARASPCRCASHAPDDMATQDGGGDDGVVYGDCACDYCCRRRRQACDAAAVSARSCTRAVCGVYHSSIAVFGLEAYFEGGVAVAATGRTRFGRRYATHVLGVTTRTLPEWLAWLRARERDTYALADYDMLQCNCHHFSDAATHFLLQPHDDGDHTHNNNSSSTANATWRPLLPRYVLDNVSQLQRSRLADVALHVLMHTSNAYLLVAARQLHARLCERHDSAHALARAIAACGVSAAAAHVQPRRDDDDDDGATARLSLSPVPDTMVMLFATPSDTTACQRAVRAVASLARRLLVAHHGNNDNDSAGGGGVLSRDALPTLRALADDLASGVDTLDARGACVFVEVVSTLLHRVTCAMANTTAITTTTTTTTAVAAVVAAWRHVTVLLDGLRLAMLHTMVLVPCAFDATLLTRLAWLGRVYAQLRPRARLALLRVLCNLASHSVGALVLRDVQYVATWVSVVAHGLAECAHDRDNDDDEQTSEDDDDEDDDDDDDTNNDDDDDDEVAGACVRVYTAACLAVNLARALVVAGTRATLAQELRQQPGTHGVHTLTTVLLYNLRMRTHDELPERVRCLLLLALLRLVSSCTAARTFAAQHPYKLRHRVLAARARSAEARATLCILKTLDELLCT